MAIISHKRRGFALVVAVIFMSVMLSLGIALGSLGYKQQILASDAVQSQYAFYAADAGLECVLEADQQGNTFAYENYDGNPKSIECDGITSLVTQGTPSPSYLVSTARVPLESNVGLSDRCADVSVHKPPAGTGGTTYVYAQGYNVPCATVSSPDGARLISRGLKSKYQAGVPKPSPGAKWDPQQTPANNAWTSVAYGNNLFVAVSRSGASSRVMRSTNGTSWTASGLTGVPDSGWVSVTYGNGRFVAVATDGANRVMTSTNGRNWTAVGIVNGVQTNAWTSVTYGNGQFLAVACNVSSTGCGTTVGDRAMTSVDGTNWVAQPLTLTNQWRAVTYGEGVFVAVANSGTDRVATSPDGITWSIQPSPFASSWWSVTYGGGKFVAVARGPFGADQVMVSENGSSWSRTGITGVPKNVWTSVAYGNGTFVAVACGVDDSVCNQTGGLNRVMVSDDGLQWRTQAAASANSWNSVVYGRGLFAAVSSTGAGYRVMTSGEF